MADARLGSMVAEVDGQGPDVVMIHGLGGSSNSFTPILSYADKHRIIRPDLPGAARSAYQPGRIGIKELADSVYDILRALEIRKACFVGHSMGTLICLHIAATQPALVSQLILFGAILDLAPQARSNLKQRAENAQREGMSAIAEAVAAGSLAPRSNDHYAASKAFVRESLLRQDPIGYAAHCLALAAMVTVDHSMIDCPVQLIHGREDNVAPAHNATQLAHRLPHGSITMIPSCGHWPMLEAPSAAGTALQHALRADQ